MLRIHIGLRQYEALKTEGLRRCQVSVVTPTMGQYEALKTEGLRHCRFNELFERVVSMKP